MQAAGAAGNMPRTLRMTNFPAMWGSSETKVRTKVRDLLNKFGELEGVPVVSRSASGAFVAVASFLDAAHARDAVGVLHNVDNRSEALKKQANYAPPKDSERFCVEIVAPEAGGVMRLLRIRDLPAEWSEQDLKELCNQYGEVSSVVSDGPGRFLVTFRSREIAEAARRALQGLQVQSEAGVSHLQCELAAEEVEKAVAAAEAYDPEMGSAPSEEDGPPLLLYVDELHLLVQSSEIDPGDREIYLRDLPLEDYTEPQLHEWLDSFGKTDRKVFLVDPATKQLSGRGYARFAAHEDAASLIAAFPVDDADGNVQGSWSLSERLLKGAAGPLRVDLIPKILERLAEVQKQIEGCSSLVLSGGGHVHGSAAAKRTLTAQNLVDGPLLVAAWPRDALLSGTQLLALRGRLSAVLAEALADPSTFTGRPLAPLPPTRQPPVGGGGVGASASLSASHRAEGGGGRRGDGEQSDGGGDGDMSDVSDDCDAGLDPAEPPTSPCILVGGFPSSWTEQEVKLVFALYGGVSAVRFVRKPSGGRRARVELKIPENLEKAVQQLNGERVGDGDIIEECTISCELLAGAFACSSGTKAGSGLRTIFIDELPMPKRPAVAAGEHDVEVFLSSLPVTDCSEDQIKGWLEGFGVVQEIYLLRDAVGVYTGKGYVRFTTHREANACVEAQAAAADQEEGDVAASWSESERAAQRQNSVYGVDVHSAFVGSSGRVISSLLMSARLKELFMLSEVCPPRELGAPMLQGKQLHFAGVCDEAHFEDLKSALSAALTALHERVAKRIHKEAKERPVERPTPWSAPPSSDSWQGYQRLASTAPPGSWGFYRPPDAAGGGCPPPGPPGSYPYTRTAYAAPPGAGTGGSAPAPAGAPPLGWNGAGSGSGWAPAPPPGFSGASPSLPTARGHDGSEEAACASSPGAARENGRRRGQRADPEEAPLEGPPFEPAVQAKIDKGEKLIRDARSSARKGFPAKAYDRFCRGLESLLSVMPKLEEDQDPRAPALRLRISGYLDEAEVQKRKSDMDGEAFSGAVEAPVQEPQQAAEVPDEGHHHRRKRRRTGADSGKEPRTAHYYNPEKAQAAAEGEDLIKQAEKLEALGNVREAYEKYCRGLQILLDCMPKLEEVAKGDPHNAARIGSYLERAERLKLELNRTEAPGLLPAGGGLPSRSRSVGGHRHRRHGSRHRRHRSGEVAGDGAGGGTNGNSGGEVARDRRGRHHRDRGVLQLRDRSGGRQHGGGGVGGAADDFEGTRMKAGPSGPPVSLRPGPRAQEEPLAGVVSKAGPQRRH